MVENSEQATRQGNIHSLTTKGKTTGFLQPVPEIRLGWLLGWIVPFISLITWELLSRNGVVPTNLLPAPSVVLKAIYDLAVRGELVNHITITLFRVVVGFAIGTVISTILGAVTGYSSRYRRLLDPTLQALRNIPSMAWVPLFLLWMGIYETSKITLIAVGVLFPVYLNLMSGIQTVDRKLLEVGKVFGLSSFQMIKQIIIPATLPAYIIGLRSGLSLGWMFVVAAEIMGASQGIGFLMIDGQMTGRPAIILGSVILFAIFGKLTDMALAYIGSYVIRWQKI
ncbi:ABC transporter permease [Pelosinus sp. sgz500959]|uniref:ABC transporter permease n=1 Tax=Pelosinus sp. sgz500959 TaxID=3242472 RepID=UPI0036708AF0